MTLSDAAWKVSSGHRLVAEDDGRPVTVIVVAPRHTQAETKAMVQELFEHLAANRPTPSQLPGAIPDGLPKQAQTFLRGLLLWESSNATNGPTLRDIEALTGMPYATCGRWRKWLADRGYVRVDPGTTRGLRSTLPATTSN